MSLEASNKIARNDGWTFSNSSHDNRFFENLLKRILFKKCIDIVFISVYQYPKDHQDSRSVLKNLEIKAFKVFTAKSRGKGEVTKKQSVDSKKIRVPL